MSLDGENLGRRPLSVRDRKKAAGMLKKCIWAEDGLEAGWRREMQVMLMVGIKVEMEILAERLGGLEGWVEGKLLAGEVRITNIVDDVRLTGCGV